MTEVYIAIGALAACLMISYAIFKKGNQKKVEFKKEAPKYVPIARSLTLNWSNSEYVIFLKYCSVLFDIDICPGVEESDEKDEPWNQQHQAKTVAQEISEATSVFPIFFEGSVWNSAGWYCVIVVLFGYCQADQETGDEAALVTYVCALPPIRIGHVKALIRQEEE